MRKAVKVLAVASILGAGCGDSGNVGYTHAACVGADIRCELPKPVTGTGIVYPTPQEVTPALASLEPTWAGVAMGQAEILTGTNGTLWAVEFSEGSLSRARQFSADGLELGAIDIPPPA